MKRVALIMHGGVGPPGSDRTVPAIMGLVERLADSFEVTVYTRFTPDGKDRSYRCGRATVKCVGTRHDLSGRVFALLALARFLRDHRANPFSVVHGFWGVPGGLVAVIAGKLAGIRSVVTVLGGEAACLPAIGYGNMRRSMRRRVTLWTLREADDVTMLTRFQVLELNRFGFTRTDGLHIIPFGPDPSLFPYAARGERTPAFHLLHVGHLNRVKDQRTLLKAFALMSRRIDCHLRIVGEGMLDHDLRDLVRKLGIEHRVTFFGFVRHDRLAPHFAWADLLMHTSLYEGQGVVFAEAAASGLPVCGTRVGLLADLGSSFAETVPPGDHEALADAAVSLLGDTSRMNSLRRSARAWAAVHTASWTAARFADIYASAFERHTRGIMSATRSIQAEAPAFFLLAAICLTAIFSTALVQTFVFLLTLTVVARVISDPRRGIRRTPLDLSYLAFVGGRIVSVLFSQDLVRSLPSLYIEMFYYVVFFLVTQSIRRNETASSVRLATFLLVAGAVAGMIGTGKVLAGIEPRALSTTAGTYTLGGYLCVVLPLAALLPASPGGTIRRWLRVVAPVAIGSGIVMTFDRLHWVEAAAVVAAFALIGMERKRWVFLSCGLSAFLFLPSVQLRIGRTLAYADFLGGRGLLWSGALQRIGEHPLVGFGPRTFTEIFPGIESLPVRGVGSWHNDYVQVYMDSGLLALIPLVWLIVSIVIGAVRTLRRPTLPPGDRRIIQTLLVSIGAVVIFGGVLDTHVGIVFRILLALFALQLDPHTRIPVPAADRGA